MFEYSYNPSEGMLDHNFKFSYQNLQKLADISCNIWDEDEEVWELMDSYGSPFWRIWEGRNVIKIEIHAKFDKKDIDFVINKFKETVNKSVRFLAEMSFSKGGNL